MSSDTKRLEQYHKIRAVLKHIADEQLEEDPILVGINSAMRLAVTQMLLGAEPQFVVSELQKHIGTITPMTGIGAPGLPQMPAQGTTPMPPQGPPPGPPGGAPSGLPGMGI